MQQNDYDSENFYEMKAIQFALDKLIEALISKKFVFNFNLYEADPRSFYLKNYAPDHESNDSSQVTLSFAKLFFYDGDYPINVRYTVDKYAVIYPDFRIEYLENTEGIKGKALDLAYIARNKEALGTYVTIISGLYYSRLDIKNLVDSLRFEKENQQLDIIHDLPEHDQLLNPVFPEEKIMEFITNANKMLTEEYKIDYHKVFYALKAYWRDYTDIEKWDPKTDLEVCIIGDQVKIMSISKKIVIF